MSPNSSDAPLIRWNGRIVAQRLAQGKGNDEVERTHLRGDRCAAAAESDLAIKGGLCVSFLLNTPRDLSCAPTEEIYKGDEIERAWRVQEGVPGRTAARLRARAGRKMGQYAA